MASEAQTSAARPRSALRRSPWRAALALAAACLCGAAHAGGDAPTGPGISGPSAQSAGVRHALRWPQLQALAGKRLRDPAASRLLAPALAQALGARYQAFNASMADDKPLRIEGSGLIGEGVVPDTLAYQGAFFVFGSRGEVFAVLKSGRHGTTIERYGTLAVLKDPALLHAYQEFIGVDE